MSLLNFLNFAQKVLRGLVIWVGKWPYLLVQTDGGNNFAAAMGPRRDKWLAPPSNGAIRRTTTHVRSQHERMLYPPSLSKPIWTICSLPTYYIGWHSSCLIFPNVYHFNIWKYSAFYNIFPNIFCGLMSSVSFKRSSVGVTVMTSQQRWKRFSLGSNRPIRI